MAKDKMIFFSDTASTTESSMIPLKHLHHIDVANTAVTSVFNTHQDGTENIAAVTSIALTTGTNDEETVLEQLCKLFTTYRGGVIDVVTMLDKVTLAEVTETA